MQRKSFTKTTLEKIKDLIQVEFNIPPRDFTDNESFAIMGISPMQMTHFLTDIEARFAVTIDFNRINFFDIDSPLKLANLVDKLAI